MLWINLITQLCSSSVLDIKWYNRLTFLQACLKTTIRRSLGCVPAVIISTKLGPRSVQKYLYCSSAGNSSLGRIKAGTLLTEKKKTPPSPTADTVERAQNEDAGFCRSPQKELLRRSLFFRFTYRHRCCFKTRREKKTWAWQKWTVKGSAVKPTTVIQGQITGVSR